MVSDSMCRPVLCLSLLVLGFLCRAGTKTQIIPLRTNATYPTRSAETRWSVPIKSVGGETLYVLSLEPDFDVGHRVLTLELALRHPSDKPDAPNLLDPTGRRHGLQPYDFAASDLAHGIDNSAFGRKRTVRLKTLGLVVRITVSKTAVRPISAGNYQLDALELQIEVDNSDS